MLNAPQIHLLINHVPLLGVVFGLILLACGMIIKSELVQKIALVSFVLLIIPGTVTYFSGEFAEDLVEKLPNISESLIEKHEHAAIGASGGLWFLAGISILALLQPFWGNKFKKYLLSPFVLLIALLLFGWLAQTAHLGGLISHPEIRGEMSNPKNHLD